MAQKRGNEEENFRKNNKKYYNPKEDHISVAKDRIFVSTTK